MSRSTTSAGSGVDLPTLVVTALASAAAAYVTSKLWAPGTLAAAAFTPVLVALIKEMLFKPVEVVTRAVPVRGVVRSAPAAGEREEPRETPAEIEARIAQIGEAPGASTGLRRPRWQLAVVTGLLGFLVAAVIITVPELVAGSSASGGDRGTTFFGGHHRSSREPTDTTTTTTPSTDSSETVPLDQTVTVPPPAETITVPPPAPSTTVPDAGATPPPAATTPEVPATPTTP